MVGCCPGDFTMAVCAAHGSQVRGSPQWRRMMSTDRTDDGAGGEGGGETEQVEADNEWLREISNQINSKANHDLSPTKDEYHRAYVNATYNNTVVTVTDANGDTVNWSSCGTVGFKGARRSTAFAAQSAGQAAAQKAKERGVSTVRVLVKGLGQGRATAVKGLQLGGLSIISITDNTPVPHNGCRPKKARRL